MIHLITRGNAQGYLASYVLKATQSDRLVEVTYVKEFLTVDGFLGWRDDAELTIMLGFPYDSRQEDTMSRALTSKIGGNSRAVIHIASFGARIEDPRVLSLVDTEVSPSRTLLTLIEDTAEGRRFEAQLDPHIREGIISTLVDIGDDYHRYDLSQPRVIHPVDLNELLITYREASDSVLLGGGSIGQILQDNATLLHARRVYREHYINERIATARVEYAGSMLVVLLYAEHYVNEIAHQVISQYSAVGAHQITVLIGRSTKGSDLFSVRTLNAHAGDIASLLNKGGGKEDTASVFLGKASKSTEDVVISMLTNHMQTTGASLTI